MLDHVGLRVAAYEPSKRFYAAAQVPLGYAIAMEGASGAGFRRGFIPDFWIKHPNYYGAFVLDPGGCNIEATCHQPE